MAAAEGVAWRPSTASTRTRSAPGGSDAAIEQSFDDMVAFNRRSAKSHSGIWRDLAVRKRRTEIDAQLVPILPIARRHGLGLPLLARLVELIHELEQGAVRHGSADAGAPGGGARVMTGSFAGRTVLVTGAAHGFGRAIAHAFAGAWRHRLGLRPGSRWARGDRAARAPASAMPDPPMSATAQLGRGSWSPQPARIDILVNNAGGVRGQVGRPIEEVSEADWQAIVDVNLTGAFLCAQAVVPGMKRQRWGRIVNISSGAGLGVSLTGIQAYASAKAGQIGLTRQLAHELGPFGITVNNVAPGFVRSNPTTERQWEAMGEAGPDSTRRKPRHPPARQPAGHRARDPVLRRRGVGLDHRPDLERRRRQDLPMTNAVQALLTAGFDGYVAELNEFCRIPSVSTDPAYADGIAPAPPNGWRDGCRPRACDNVEIAPTGGHPAVLAEWLGAPAGRAHGPGLRPLRRAAARPAGGCGPPRPSSPTVRDGRLYARGAADDKGPVLVPILVAEAFLRAEGRAAGQPQVSDRGRGGGRQRPSRRRSSKPTPDRLAADTVVSADGAMWRVDLPTVTVASRGICALEFTRPRRRQGSALRPAWRHRAEPAACHRQRWSRACTTPTAG